MNKDSDLPRPHQAEWLLVLLEAVVAGSLLARLAGIDIMPGQLLPCLAVALAPGTAFRLLGKPSLAAHRVGVAGGLVLFLFTNGTLDFSAFPRIASNWRLVVPALILIFLQPVLGAARWLLLLRAHDIHLSYRESLRLGLVGYFFNNFVPGSTGGDIFRALYVARGRGNTGGAVSSVILDRCIGLPPLILIVLVAAMVNGSFVGENEGFAPYWTVITIAAGVGLGVIALVVAGVVWMPKLVERIEGIIPGGRGIRKLTDALQSYRQCGPVLVVCFMIGLVAHIATVVSFIMLGEAAGIVNVPYGLYFLLVPVGMTINSIPLTPGGLGQGEAAFSRLFEVAAAGTGEAGALTMLCTRAGYVLCGMVGGIIYACGKHSIDEACAQAEILIEAGEPVS